MKHKSKIFCTVCGSNDSWSKLEYNYNNRSYKATCCGRYLSFIKWDDEEHRNAMAEVKNILIMKCARGDFHINKESLLKNYSNFHEYIFLNEVMRMASIMNDRFELV